MRLVRRSLGTGFAMIGLMGCNLLPLTGTQQDFPEFPPAQPSAETKAPTVAKDCGGDFTPEQRMYLELVHKMVEQKQFYGAVANLDQLEKSAPPSPQTIYLRAEALRGAEQPGLAEKQYRLLLNGCMAGYGLHGLGLLATEAGQLEQAEDYLARACHDRPVDANVHNDFGMVMLLRGNYQNAHKEFMTAMELDHSSRLPVENLIVLMLLEKQNIRAQRLAAERGLTSQEIEHLHRRAQRLDKPQLSDNPTRP